MNDHIQISDVTPRIQYAADGSQTQFSYPFPIFVEDDLEVYSGDTRETSGYTVLGAGSSFGGTVTFDTPPASGVVVTLRRSLAIERTTDFQQSGAFRAKVINDELDHLTAALQQVADDVGRAVRLHPTAADAGLELPSRDDRANKVLGFDASGDVIATSGSGGAGDGVTDHGQLTGLSDDDHDQYHNDARGDARYYTQAQVDAFLGGKSDTTHNHDAAYAAISHVNDTSNPHGVTKTHLDLDNVENTKVNLSANVDPTQNDDANNGYTVGSRWINVAANREFVCLEATPGTATWVETTQTGGGGTSDHGGLTGLGDDDHPQYHTDSRAAAWFGIPRLSDYSGVDDGERFDNFISAAKTAGMGYIDAGTWDLSTATMQVNLTAPLRLYGAGTGLSILDFGTARDSHVFSDANVLFWLESGGLEVSGIQFKRFPFVFAASDGSLGPDLLYDSFAVSGDLSDIGIRDCKFVECSFPLWIRSRGTSGYNTVSRISLNGNTAVDCKALLYAYGSGFHDFNVTRNDITIASGRAAGASDLFTDMFGVLIGSNNGDAAEALLAQTTNGSGGHVIARNRFNSLTWTGANASGVSIEARHLRVTPQNNVSIFGNYFGSISAPNFVSPGAETLNCAMVYTKVIGLQVYGNTFEGSLQGDLADTTTMLKLKGEGYYFVGTATNTLAWNAKVFGNTFRGTGTRDNLNLLNAIQVYSDMVTLADNDFKDIHCKTQGGVIVFSSHTTGSIVRDQRFEGCGVEAGGAFGHISIQEGGDGFIIDGIKAVGPCPDGVGNHAVGVFWKHIGETQDIRDMRVSNVTMTSAHATPTNTLVRVSGKNEGIVIDGLTVEGLGSDGATIDKGFWIEDFAPADVSRVVLRNSNLTGIATPLNNPASLQVIVSGCDNLEPTALEIDPHTVENEYTASGTLTIDDGGRRFISANHATVAITLTVPPNSSVAYPVGHMIIVEQRGAAAVSIVGASGVTINKPSSKTATLAEQHAQAALRKTATDTWTLGGALGTV